MGKGPYPVRRCCPLAHVGHWLWVLYLPPILIVVGSIVRATTYSRTARREDGEERLG